MSATNHTQNLELSQWLASDKPNWDIDLNGDLLKIDNFAGAQKAKNTQHESQIGSIDSAISTMQGEMTTLSDSVTAMGERVTSVEGTLASHTQSISKLNNDVSALQTESGSTTQAVEALTSQVGINTGNIATLQTQMMQRVRPHLKKTNFNSGQLIPTVNSSAPNTVTINGSFRLPSMSVSTGDGVFTGYDNVEYVELFISGAVAMQNTGNPAFYNLLNKTTVEYQFLLFAKAVSNYANGSTQSVADRTLSFEVNGVVPHADGNYMISDKTVSCVLHFTGHDSSDSDLWNFTATFNYANDPQIRNFPPRVSFYVHSSNNPFNL